VKSRRRGIAALAGGALCASLAVGGGVAIASIPSTTTGAITACVNRSTSAVRIIDYQAGRRCSAAETTLNWSKGYTYRGAWSASVTYSAQDVVLSGGASYVARTASRAQSPASVPTAWNLLAARGAAGPPGPRGPSGFSGYNVVTQYVTVNTGTQRLVDVQCPSGQVPVGGGAHYGNAFPGLGNAQWAYVSESSIDESRTGWASTLVVTPNQGNTYFEANAICVNA
jgi:hypothetical protein